MFPMSATDITVLQFLGASTLLGDVDGEPETDEPTAEEIHEAETQKSECSKQLLLTNGICKFPKKHFAY